MAFISSVKYNSGNKEVNTASVSTASTNVSYASANIRAASISQDIACAYIASQSNGKKISIQGTNVARFDKSKVECFNCHKMGHFTRECRASRSQDRGRRDNYRQRSKVKEQTPKALMAIDGMGWDWSFMVNGQEDHALVSDEEASIEFALMAKTSAESKVEGRLVEFKNQEIKVYEKIRGLEVQLEFKINRIESLTNELEFLKKEKGIPEFADDIVTDYSRPSPAIESTSNDVQNRNSSETEASYSTISSKPFIKFLKATVKPTKNKIVKVETIKKPVVKACFYCGHFDHLSYDCGLGVKRGRSCPKNNCSNKSMTPRAVIHKPYRPPMRPVRPNMNVSQPKRTSFHKLAHLYSKRPFQRTLAVRSQFRALWVPTVNRNFPTVNRKFPTVNRKFPTDNTKFSTADLGNKGTTVKPSACWNWKPLQNLSNKGPNRNSVSVMLKKYTYIDTQGRLNGFSWHMTGNISYLFDYEPFNRGYVSFGQGGCKITGKGTIKIECTVLGRDFKLTDDTNVLLRTPMPHNTYSINLNNIVPHKDLTCLVAKVHDALLESPSSNAQDTCKADAPESSRNSNPTASTTSPPADQMETLTVETPIPTVILPVLTTCFTDFQEPSSDTRLISKKVTNQEETPSLDNILTLTNRFEDIIGVTTNSDDSNGVEADEEVIDYDEVFAHVERIKAIRLFLAYASFMGFIVYQMDVKSAFLYGTINEEVYVIQPPGFHDPEFPTRLYKVEKAMYGLHQAPRAWYVYVDDILFGSSNPQLCREIEALMHEKFQMSAMGELNFFLGLLDIMFAVYACARHQVTPKECHLHVVKRIFRYLKGHLKLGLWYLKESLFDLVAYSDSDYGGATQDHKSTTRGCQFLGGRLISWQCKKHTIMATSTTEAEYVAAASGCGQVLWIQNQLLDYGDCFEKKLISVDHIHTDENVADLLTKPFDVWRFKYLVFWSTVRIETTKEGTKILPSVNGNLRTVIESSIRRNLKLNDEGEGSGTPTEPHHTPSSEAQQTSPTTHSSPSLPPVPTESLPPVIPTDTPLLRHYTRRARIAQSLGLPPVANEPASPIGDVSQGEACPTNFGLEANQDRVNIPKTSTLPSNSTPRVTSLAADEDTQELEINSLKAIIKLLEDKERGVTDQSGDDALIKGRRLDKGEEVAERVNDDTEEMATVLTSMDVASILTSGGVQVAPTTAEVATPTISIPTGSGVVSTTNPTASPIFTTATKSTPYTRRKARDAQRMNEQIAQDAEIMRIHAKEELQMLIDGLDRNNETVPKYLQEYYQFATELPIERRIELINDLVKYQDHYAKLLNTRLNKKSPSQGSSKKSFICQCSRVMQHFDREDLNQLWGLVKETLSIRPTISDKEIELWVELKRLPRYIHADIEGLPSEEGSGDYDDQLQASCEKLLSDGK
nr:hypothetical protein [Tanacetum cinerariifolium]